jgi:hypothetical protein
MLIVYLPTALYTLWQLQHSRKKIMLFSAVSTIVFAVAFEMLAAQFNLWVSVGSIYKLLGVNVENLLFFLLHMIIILGSYELFVDGDKQQSRNKHLPLLLFGYLLFSLVVIALNQNWLWLPVNYLNFGLVTIFIPMLVLMIVEKTILRRVLLISFIWLIPILVNEIVMVNLGYITYTGSYFHVLELFGASVPIEELMFWVVFSTPVLLLGYEYFVDDGN